MSANMQQRPRLPKDIIPPCFPSFFQQGNLVLRRVLKGEATNKLTPNWGDRLGYKKTWRMEHSYWSNGMTLYHMITTKTRKRQSVMTIVGTKTRKRQSVDDCPRH
ncbi:hypothetical protein CR513_28483, partial [Mucuna pruriens]